MLRADITEQESLLDTDEQISSAATQSTCIQYIGPAVQVGLGSVGAFASLLYWNAMPACAAMEKCGKWLADLTSPQTAQTLLFISGGGGYALSSIYFAVKSVPAFIKLMRETHGVGYKILKASFVSSFVVVHSFGVYFAALSGTDDKTGLTFKQKFIMGATIAGATPGTLFTGVNATQDELWLLPNFLKYSKLKVHQLLSYYLPSSFALSEYEQSTLHYQAQQKLFLRRLEENWQMQLAHLATAPSLFRGGDEPLVALFNQQQAEIKPYSWGTWIVENTLFTTCVLGGSVLAASFVIPIGLNNFNETLRYQFTLPWIGQIQLPETLGGYIGAGILSGLLTFSAIYNSQKVLFGASSWLFNVFNNLFNGRWLNSLSLQRYPKTTLAIFAFVFGTQWLSYSLVDVQFEKNYKDEWLWKEVLFYLAIIGIDVFHAAASVSLGHELLSRFVQTRFVKDELNKDLFALQDKIEQLKRLPLDKFIEFVKEQVEEGNASVLGLEPYMPEGQLIEFNAPRELLPTNPYEKEASDEEQHSDEDVISVRIRSPSKNVASIGFFGASKNNMPASLLEARQQRQANRRCCSVQ